MKRQVIAALVGSLFAVPAFATGNQNAQQVNEWEYPALAAAPAVARADVLAELVQAKHKRRRHRQRRNRRRRPTSSFRRHYPAHAVVASKSRAEVLDELVDAEREGDSFANAETGMLAKDL